MTIVIGATGASEIAQNVEMIVSTPKGSVPLDRAFGIDYTAILDQPFPVAKALLAAQVVEAVQTYEPRVKVTQVDFEEDQLSGRLVPIVHFEPVESEVR